MEILQKILKLNMLAKSLDIKHEAEYILAMKKFLMVVLPILFVFVTVYAGAFLDYFHGRSEGEDVRLEWKTSEEVNLQNFKVERKTPQSSFVEISTIEPKGSNSYYSYLDQSAYKQNDLVFIYRLKIVENGGQTSYSAEVTVSHNVSGVRRTWGSIKAMFR